MKVKELMTSEVELVAPNDSLHTAAKMMAELGHDISALGIARHYASLLDGLVIDTVDAALKKPIEELGIAVHLTDTLMRDTAGRKRLGDECLAFAATLRK